MGKAQRDALLLALLSAPGFDQACEMAGVSRAAALLARTRNPGFAAEWDKVVESRIAEVDARLVDLAIRGLGPDVRGDGQSDQQVKQSVSVGQWLVEARRRPPARSAQQSEKPAAKKQPRPDQEAKRLDMLFETICQRLEAAEALHTGKPKP